MYQKHTILKEKKVEYNGNIICIEPKERIAIALASNQSDKAICTVEVGDKVKIGSLLGYIGEDIYLPIYSSVSGTVIAFEYYQYCTLQKVKHVIIENDFNDEKIPLYDNVIDFHDYDRLQLIEAVKKSGIVGMSGAGFATYGKYLGNCDVLIINGCECESYLITDYVNVINNCRDMLDGVLILEKMAAAKETYIVLKNTAVDEIEKIRKLIEENNEYNHLKIYLIDDFYPCGWERLLTEKITGRKYNIYTTECGVIVNNISSAIAVKQVFSNNMPVIDKLITVGGNGIKQSAVVKTRIGCSIKEIINACGGRENNTEIYCGGTMMGSIMDDDNFFICQPYNGLIVEKKAEQVAQGQCDDCDDCNDYCCCSLDVKKLLNICKNKDYTEAVKNGINDCCECGICSYICSKHIDVRKYIRYVKYNFMEENK